MWPIVCSASGCASKSARSSCEYSGTDTSRPSPCSSHALLRLLRRCRSGSMVVCASLSARATARQAARHSTLLSDDAHGILGKLGRRRFHWVRLRRLCRTRKAAEATSMGREHRFSARACVREEVPNCATALRGLAQKRNMGHSNKTRSEPPFRTRFVGMAHFPFLVVKLQGLDCQSRPGKRARAYTQTARKSRRCTAGEQRAFFRRETKR